MGCIARHTHTPHPGPSPRSTGERGARPLAPRRRRVLMTPDTHLTRRQLLRWSRAGALACAGLSVVLPACDPDGNFTILGYTTQPNYDCKYKTVRVPIFQNKTFRRG